MQNIQFRHIHEQSARGGRTLAVELPTSEDFGSLISNLERTVTLNVGLAVCSDKEYYVKSVGRSLSSERLAPVTFNLLQMNFDKKVIYFILLSQDEKIAIKLRTHNDSNRIWLIDANF